MTISLFKQPSYLIMNMLPYSFTPGYGLHGKVIFGSSDGLPTVRCHYLNRCSQLAISDFVWRMATNIYRQTSSISLTKLKNLIFFSSRRTVVFAHSIKASGYVDHLSAVLQQHLNDQQVCCLLRCRLYQRFDGTNGRLYQRFFFNILSTLTQFTNACYVGKVLLVRWYTWCVHQHKLFSISYHNKILNFAKFLQLL